MIQANQNKYMELHNTFNTHISLFEKATPVLELGLFLVKKKVYWFFSELAHERKSLYNASSIQLYMHTTNTNNLST